MYQKTTIFYIEIAFQLVPKNYNIVSYKKYLFSYFSFSVKNHCRTAANNFPFSPDRKRIRPVVKPDINQNRLDNFRSMKKQCLVKLECFFLHIETLILIYFNTFVCLGFIAYQSLYVIQCQIHFLTKTVLFQIIQFIMTTV